MKDLYKFLEKLAGFGCATIITLGAFTMGYDGQVALIVTLVILGVDVASLLRGKKDA